MPIHHPLLALAQPRDAAPCIAPRYSCVPPRASSPCSSSRVRMTSTGFVTATAPHDARQPARKPLPTASALEAAVMISGWMWNQWRGANRALALGASRRRREAATSQLRAPGGILFCGCFSMAAAGMLDCV